MSSPSLEQASWVENAAPAPGLPRLDIGQVWRHRELVFFFAQRDVKVRYKQAFLGASWAVVQPLLGALTFTLLFDRLVEVDIGDVAYFPFALVGFVAWTYFSMACTSGSTSLLSNAELLTKVAFPRIVSPASALLPPFVDLLVGVIVAIVASAAFGALPDPLSAVAGLALGTALLVVAAAGPALFFSALVVKYRDASALVSFGLQLFVFVSPVAYPASLVPDRWLGLYYANPVAGALGLLRSGITDVPAPATIHLLISTVAALILFIAGLAYFRKNERELADVI